MATSSAPAQFVSTRDKAILADPAALAAEHLRLARQTRGAVVLVAWIIGIFAAISLVVGIVVAGQVTVVLRFASKAAVRACYESPEYQAIMHFRTDSSEGIGVIAGSEAS